MNVRDELIRTATFAADVVAMRPHNTAADQTRAVVAITLDSLINQGFLRVIDPEAWPMWVAVNPEDIDGLPSRYDPSWETS